MHGFSLHQPGGRHRGGRSPQGQAVLPAGVYGREGNCDGGINLTNQFAEIPDTFWGLFRSGNRQIYIEALLQINEEYQYSNYYLSREVCIRTLSDYFARRNVELTQDEWEDDFDLLEPQSIRILNWL